MELILVCAEELRNIEEKACRLYRAALAALRQPPQRRNGTGCHVDPRRAPETYAFPRFLSNKNPTQERWH